MGTPNQGDKVTIGQKTLYSIIAIILIAIVGVVILLPLQANASESKIIVVPADMVYQISFNFDRGTIFNGSVAVSGGSGTYADFIYCHINRPAGSMDLFPYGHGGVTGIGYFNFVAPETTGYTVVFANRDTTSRTVTMDYDINYLSNNTGGGMDFGNLLIIIGVVVILLIIVALAFALNRRKRLSKTSQTPPPSNPQPPSST